MQRSNVQLLLMILLLTCTGQVLSCNGKGDGWSVGKTPGNGGKTFGVNYQKDNWKVGAGVGMENKPGDFGKVGVEIKF